MVIYHVESQTPRKSVFQPVLLSFPPNPRRGPVGTSENPMAILIFPGPRRKVGMTLYYFITYQLTSFYYSPPQHKTQT